MCGRTPFEAGLSMVEWKLQGSRLPRGDEEWQAAFDKYKQYPEFQLSNFDMTVRVQCQSVDLVFFLSHTLLFLSSLVSWRSSSRSTLWSGCTACGAGDWVSCLDFRRCTLLLEAASLAPCTHALACSLDSGVRLNVACCREDCCVTSRCCCCRCCCSNRAAGLGGVVDGAVRAA